MAWIVSFVVGSTLVAALMILLERWRPSIPAQPLLRKGFATDLGYWFLTPIVTRSVTRLGVIAALALVVVGSGHAVSITDLRDGYGPVARQPTWLQAVQLIVLIDFLGYWQHRLFHGRTLWPFHAVHHSPEELDWLSSVRVHPVNDLLGRMLVAVPLIAIGYSPLLLVGIVPILTVYAILLHANVDWDFGPLRGVIASPVFHRWHHTSAEEGRDRNFAGLLPVWDILFGTYYMPGHAPTRFGVDEAVPETLPAQILWPFRQIFGRREN